MKIRLHGTEDECRELAGRLAAITDVVSVSGPYPDRGASRLVRDLETRPYPVSGPHVTAGTEPGPQRPDERASALAQQMPGGRRYRALPPGGAK